MIYLATPYSHTDHTIMTLRFHQAAQASARLLEAGHLVFSPIVHSHPIVLAGKLPRDFEFWREYNEWFIARFDLLCVVKMDGWEESKGIKAEIEIAERHKVPVIYVEYGREKERINSFLDVN